MEADMEQRTYKRRIYIINRKFQFRYLFIILAVMIIAIGAVSFTTFYIIWDRVINEFFFVPDAAQKLSGIFIKTSQALIVPVIVLMLIFSLIGVLFSHRIAGPLYRVEKVAEELGKGNLDLKVKFRKNDEFHNLADALNKMIGGIKGMVIEDKEIAGDLSRITGKLQQDIEKQKGLEEDVKIAVRELNAIVKKLKEATDRFKV